MQSAEIGVAAPRKGWTLALSSVGVFMAALDALVVTTALPVRPAFFRRWRIRASAPSPIPPALAAQPVEAAIPAVDD